VGLNKSPILKSGFRVQTKPLNTTVKQQLLVKPSRGDSRSPGPLHGLGLTNLTTDLTTGSELEITRHLGYQGPNIEETSVEDVPSESKSLQKKLLELREVPAVGNVVFNQAVAVGIMSKLDKNVVGLREIVESMQGFLA
jgi:hypothetical protein